MSDPNDFIAPEEQPLEASEAAADETSSSGGFNPENAVFQGVQLIEASAGTGKTWNIAALVVRAIREGMPGQDTPLTIDQILVVTFGEAATKELRDRVRRRLFEEMKEEKDPTIRMRLEDAVRGFDEASIFTIHGFCQRALQENAFESGVLFDFELVPDSQSLTLETADDFWWQMTQRESLDVVDLLLDLGLSPHELVSLAERVPRVEGDVNLVPVVKGSWVQRIRQVVDTYRHRCQDYFQLLSSKWKAEEKTIRAAGIPFPLLCDLADWMEGRRIFPSRLIRREIIDAVEDGGKQRNDSPLFALIRSYHQASFKELQAIVNELRVVLLREWLTYRDEELGKRKRKANALFFDDLLYQLDEALRNSGGHVLAKRIRAKYPLALIDEFQDTDLTQFSIFKTVYNGDNESACLFLIGDPKQSIYGFRRADIYSYLSAKQEAANRETLYDNYRSEPDMVEGVNGLFTFRENPFLEKDIPFHRVTSKDQAGRFLLNGKPMPALSFRLVRRSDFDTKAKKKDSKKKSAEEPPPKPKKGIPKGSFTQFVVEHTSLRIANLLNLGQSGDAIIRTTNEKTEKKHDRGVVPGDVAVLVRTHLQARQMQSELSSLGVASVLQSQGKIFDTPETGQLLQVLAAIESPFDQARLRTALLTPIFGQTVEDLVHMESDPVTFEKWLTQLQDYRLVWDEQGFTTMFTRLLNDHRVAPRLLKTPRGERRMTNLQHLGELLGKEDNERRGGPGGLVQWLADQQGVNRAEDERELRLESDAKRVQIVTMHHAKGLEYGIVFVPFAWSIRGEEKRHPVGFYFHDRANSFAPTWDLGTTDDLRERHLARYREEKLAEEIRLLYVALTRAKHVCSVVWGPAANAENSSLAYLIHGEESGLATMEDREVEAAVAKVVANASGTISSGPLKCGVVHHKPDMVDTSDLVLASTTRSPGIPYRISSFSALKGDRPHHDFHLPEHDDAVDTEEEPEEPPSGFYAFPGGTQTGNLVHGVFESIDFTQPETHAEVIEAQIKKHGFEPLEEAPEAIAGLVRDVLGTPLLDDGFRLADLPDAQRLVELEFFFPLNLSDPAALQEFCSVPLPGQRVEGFMKGFIDLTFEHEGQFYILDYKSNHLGTRAADYSDEILAQTMADSGYDLQYLLYTVALHRYLQSRLPDYDYDTHIGGILYLFVRAMPEAGVYYARPDKETVLNLERILCGEAQHV